MAGIVAGRRARQRRAVLVAAALVSALVLFATGESLAATHPAPAHRATRTCPCSARCTAC